MRKLLVHIRFSQRVVMSGKGLKLRLTEGNSGKEWRFG